jgi:hypothetical protein
VAVIGFDDLEQGRYTMPALSTISPDKDFIGQTAVRLLADRLASSGDGSPAGGGGPDSEASGNGGPASGSPASGGPPGPPAREVIAPYRLEARECTMGRGKR